LLLPPHVTKLTNKLPSVENRGHADRVTIFASLDRYPGPCPMIWPFNPLPAMNTTHTDAKYQDKRPVTLQAIVETDGRADGHGRSRYIRADKAVGNRACFRNISVFR